MNSITPSHEFLYSHRADEALKETVRGIQGKHDSFATDFLTLAAAAAGAQPASERVEAWKNPATGLWKLERFTRLPGAAVRQETVAQNLCFFDALDYCARFQAAALEKGGQPLTVTDARWTDVPHYRIAAEAAGQAIDADGAAHPCAHGRTLTDGWFSEKALADAAKTKGEALSIVAAPANLIEGMFGGLAVSGAPPGGAGTIVPAQALRKLDAINAFQAAVKAGDGMIKILKYIVENKFRTEFFNEKYKGVVWGFSVVTLGLLPAYFYLQGDPGVTIDHGFKSYRNKLRRATEALPPAEKSLMTEFAKAAEFTFWMERAARVYQNCRDLGRGSAAAAKGLPYIEKACAAAKFGPLDSARAADEYVSGRVTCGKFLSVLKKGWNGEGAEGDVSTPPLKNRLTEKIAALENMGGPS